MNKIFDDPVHPTRICADFLQEQFRTRMDASESTLMDIGTGSGRILIRLLKQGYRGTVYAVEPQHKMVRSLWHNFKESGLADRIELKPIIADATELKNLEYVETIESFNGEIKQITNPVYAGTKVKYVICTEIMHEGLSIPALENASIDAGWESYGSILDFIPTVLENRGLLLIQDLHGIDRSERAQYTLEDSIDGKVAKELIEWIAKPEIKIHDKYLFGDQISSDGEYWDTEKDGARRRLLTDLVTGRKIADANRGLLSNILSEAAYRVISGHADTDHEIHCGLTGAQLFGDIEDRGFTCVEKCHVDGQQAADFLRKYAGIIVGHDFPALYSAAVFRKQ
jgi:hypothetical protein